MNIHDALHEARIYNGEEHSDETYFDVGGMHDIVVSNSLLSKINPHEGGSELKFTEALTEEEEKATVNHLEKGKLLHRYIKDPRNFATVDDNKPSDTICTIIEEVLSRVNNNGDLPVQQGLITAFDQLKDVIVEVGREAGWNKNWGDDALFRNLKKDGEPYFNFLTENAGKIIMAKDIRESLDGMKLSIESHDCREYLLDNDSPHTIYKEWPIFWQWPANGQGDEIQCKSLLDNLEVNEQQKILTITDLKTTSKPVSQFMGYCRYGTDPTDGDPCRIFIDGPFHYFRIYRQFATYGEALRRGVLSKIADGGAWSINYRVVPVESKAPYEMAVYNVKSSWVRYGEEELQYCLELVWKWMQKQAQVTE